MKKTFFTTTLLVLWTLFLSGCMTTWPIVDDLDHYQKWDTYESIREKNEEEIVDEDVVEEDVVEEEVVEEEDEGNAVEEEIESIEETEDTGEDIEVKE